MQQLFLPSTFNPSLEIETTVTMQLSEFWPLCLAQLQQSLSTQQYKMWISQLTVGETPDSWTVYVKNTFTFTFIKDKFLDKIDTIKDELAPTAPQLVLQIGQGTKYEPAHAAAVIETQAPSVEDSLPAATLADVQHDDANPFVHESLDNGFSITMDETAEYANEPQQQPLLSSDLAPEPTHKPESPQDLIAQRLAQIQKNAQGKNPPKAVQQHSETAIAVERQDKGHEHTRLNPSYTFETLVQGKGNRMAYAGALTIAESPGSNMYNPYFIYGSTGLGKTHLVQAIGNRIYKNNPKARIRYIHAENYVRDIMKAFRNQGFDEFKRYYHALDLLIIDDVQFISGKDRTMEEFFYLFNHLLDEKKQVIMTCDTLPANIKDMDDRLKSRFSWGLTVELEPPELEMRVAILQKKAEAAHVQLEESAAFFIASNIRSNVRELEGAFKRVAAHSRFQNRPINIELATDALQDILAEAQKQVTIDQILKTVSDYYQIKIAEILGKKRTRNIVRPRQIAMTLAKELTQQSLPSIGNAFGGRDHTTVMHANKTIADLRKTDGQLSQDYDILMVMLRK